MTERIVVVATCDAAGVSLQSVLAASGFAVSLVPDPAEADGGLSAHEPDVVVIALEPDEVRSLSRVEALLAGAGGVPVVVVSSIAGRDDLAVRVLELGAKDFVVLPCPPHVLVARVRAALHLRPARSPEPPSAAVLALSRRDEPTGLYSCDYFVEELERVLLRARRSGEPVTCALVTPDTAAELRAACAEDAERLIQALARTAGGLCRGSDLMARFDSDTLAMLFPRTALEHASHALSRLLGRAQALEVQGTGQQGGGVTLSIGAACNLQPMASSADGIVQAARQALDRARSAGGNRVAAYVPDGAGKATSAGVRRAGAA